MAKSDLEESFANYLRLHRIEYQREYKFSPKTRHRADFYLPQYNCLIEIEGGIWSGGRHGRGAGYIKDCDKYNLATTLGYKLLRFTTQHVQDSQYDALHKILGN